MTQKGCFGHLQQLPILLSVLLVAIKSGVGIQGELIGCKSALNSPVVYSTDRSKVVVLVLVLLFVAFYAAICFVLPCVI